MASMELPTARYRSLIQQLGDELGNVHGWKRRVAETLGVHPSYVSRILSGEKLTIGSEILDRACERLSIYPAFFFDPSLGEDPPYRSCIRGDELEEGLMGAGGRAAWPGWQVAFAAAATYSDQGPFDFTMTEGPAGEEDKRAAQKLLEAAQQVPVIRAALHLARVLESEQAGKTQIQISALQLASALLAERWRDHDHER